VFEGRALVLLAEIALQADSDVERARQLADQALEVMPEDRPAGLHEAHQLLTSIAWWVGDAEACRRHGRATLELARAMRRPDLESLALSRLADVAIVETDLETARELTAQAAAIAEESGSREALAFAIVSTGRCALGANDLDGGESALRDGLAAFEEMGAAGRAGWTINMLASLELRRGDVARAVELYREGVRRLRATQEHGLLVEGERQLAEALVAAGELPEAERLAEHAYQAVGSLDNWSRASTLHALGLVRAAQGRTEDAEALLEESLAVVEPTMYRIFADQVLVSLESLRQRPAAAAQP
jgi:ATP/maltotriose-dependent transcriptional regulator MalT